MAEAAIREATYADLEAVPEHLVAEIIEGVLETHPRPRAGHGNAAHHLGFELEGPFGRGRGGPGGWVFIPEPELHLGRDIVVPGLAGWRSERMPFLPETAWIGTPPDWICEILSPSTSRLDRGAKRRIYAAAGVSYLWLLDPSDRVVEAFELIDRRWVLLATIERGAMVAVPPFDAAPFLLDNLFPFDTLAPAAPSTPEA